MINRPATHTNLPAPRKGLTVLCSLALLTALLISPSPVAGASGSVSLTIRVEVDPVDLRDGGALKQADGDAGKIASLLGPVVRRSLAGRYLPSEVDRIVEGVTGDCLVVMEGEVIAETATDAAFLSRGTGGVFVL